MASTYSSILRRLAKGFDQSKQRHLNDQESCWDLLNMRPVLGRLEQTPWVSGYQSVSNLGALRLIRLVKNAADSLKYFVMGSQKVAYIDPTTGTQTNLAIVLSTSVPQRNGLTGQCLLYGINGTDFAAIGDSISIVIATGTTFNVYRNGVLRGTHTIAQSVLIDAGGSGLGLYAAFQGQGDVTDYTGFTPGDTWVWTRMTYVPSYGVSGDSYAHNTDAYNTDVYIAGCRRDILRLRNDIVTSVGYRRTYGQHVVVFQNHLFVSQYAPGTWDAGTGVADTYTAGTTPFTLGWSHLDNPDQFYSTQINEADTFLVPQQQVSDLQKSGITGLAVWRGLLYVFTPDAIVTGQYVGLPNVMQFTNLNGAIGNLFINSVIRTPTGIYFIGRGDVYVIRGFEPESIGAKVRDRFFSDLRRFSDGLSSSYNQQLFGFYSPYTKEVIWTYFYSDTVGGTEVITQRQLVYCEKTDDWYFRVIPSNASTRSTAVVTGDCTCAAPLHRSQTQNLYGYDNYIAMDQAPGASSDALPDWPLTAFAGGAYKTPYVETQFLNYGNDAFHVKQSSGLMVDAGATSMTSVKVYASPQDLIGTGATTMTALSQQWSTGLQAVRLSLPRQAFRQLALRLEFLKTAGVPYGAVLNHIQEFITGTNQTVEK